MRDIKVVFKVKKTPGKKPGSFQISYKNKNNQKVGENYLESQRPSKFFINSLILKIITITFLLAALAGIFAGKASQKTYANVISLKNNFNNLLKIAQNEESDINNKIKNLNQESLKTRNNLEQLNKNISSLGFLKPVPGLGFCLENGNYLAKSGIHTMNSLTILSDAGGDLLKNLNLTLDSMNEEEKKEMILSFLKITPDLGKSSSEIKLANTEYNKIPFFLKQDKIKTFGDYLLTFDRIIAGSIDTVNFLPEIVGIPSEKNYLLLLQNNDELQPGGGFLGTYGILTLKNGEIKKLETDNIYNLDNAFKGKEQIESPDAIKKMYPEYSWSMRHANWWADFPSSAQKAEWFFEKEYPNPPKIDGVIALDTTVLEYLLDVTGPIRISNDEYDYTFVSGNAINILERHVEKLAGEGTPERKSIIGDFAATLLKNIFNLPKEKWPALFKNISKGFEGKHIQIYFNQKELQDFLKNYNLDNRIKETNGNYLNIVEANLSVNKDNQYLDGKINYTVSGKNAELEITHHLDSEGSWKISTYGAYLQVYVPQGAKLTKTENIDDVKVTSEFGKTILTGWIKVLPLETKTFKLFFELPDKLSPSLLIQKQPGTKNFPLKLQVDNFKWQGELNSDKEFEL